MNVGELMLHGFPDVYPTTRVVDVVGILLRYRLNGIAVVDENRALLGIVTLSDIRRKMLPTPKEITDHPEYLSQPGILEERFVDLARLEVKEIMATEVTSIPPDRHALRAGALMNAHKVQQIPVVEDGVVKGMITQQDIAWGLLMKYRRQA